jgi:hypothetical protein
MLAIERNGIKNIKSPEDLLASKAAVIEWEDDFLDEPVILAGIQGGHQGCKRGTPMMSAGITDALQVIAKRVGIGKSSPSSSSCKLPSSL